MAGIKNRRIAVMSIHPKFAKAIFDGRKKYEFRKCRIDPSVSHVLVYATSPTQRVIGVFEVGGIVEGSPRSLWERYADVSGIPSSEYRDYYSGSKKAYAIAVKAPVLLEHPVALKEVSPGLCAPQSFCYCSSKSAERLINQL